MAGGVGIGGTLVVSGNIVATGSITSQNTSQPSVITCTTASTNTATGALTVAGGVGIGGNVNIGQILNVGTALSANAQTNTVTIAATTASVSTGTGALTVAGGLGVGGTLNVQNISTVTGNVVVGNLLNTVQNAALYAHLAVYYTLSAAGLVDCATGLPNVNVTYVNSGGCVFQPNVSPAPPVGAPYNGNGTGSGYALYVPSSSASLTVTASATATASAGLTVTFWAKYATAGSTALPMVTVADGAGNYLKIKTYNTVSGVGMQNLDLKYGSNTSNSVASTTASGTTYALGVWVFNMVSVAPSGSSSVVRWQSFGTNGVNRDTTATLPYAFNPTLTSVTFGSYGGSGTNPFYVHDFRMYTADMSALATTLFCTAGGQSLINNGPGGLLTAYGLNVAGSLNVAAVNTSAVTTSTVAATQSATVAGDLTVGGNIANPRFTGTAYLNGQTMNAVGPTGPQGAQGAQGSKGDRGDQGAQGPQGAQGAQGAKGDKGDQGAQGAQGGKGDKGDQGAQGAQGDKGDQGAQGAQGPKGDQGSQGPQGSQGLAGGWDGNMNLTNKGQMTLDCIHTVSSNNYSIEAYAYLNSSGSVRGDGPSGQYVPCCLMADTGRIWLKNGEFDCSSDKRIKANIQSLDTSSALNTMNQLRPVSYNYVHQNRFKTGFVAQEMETVLPEAVRVNDEYITNIYMMANITPTGPEQYTLTVDQSCNVLDVDGSCNLLLLNPWGGRINVRLLSVSDDRTQLHIEGTIQETDTHNGQIFVYGQEVSDFRTITPEVVHNYGIAAIQELSKQLTTAQTELQETRSALAALQEQMATLITTVAQLQTTASP